MSFIPHSKNNTPKNGRSEVFFHSTPQILLSLKFLTTLDVKLNTTIKKYNLFRYKAGPYTAMLMEL